MAKKSENPNRESPTCNIRDGHIKLSIELPNSTLAKIIYKALLPEFISPPTHRSKLRIALAHSTVEITIEFTDLISARASINSILKWINTLLLVIPRLKKNDIT